MSLTATAIKLVRLGSFPSMLVYYENGEREWFITSADLPKKFWPSKQLHKDTLTARFISDEGTGDVTEDVRADKWFDVHNSDRYYVRESCFRSGPDSVATILWWEDEAQIVDLEEVEERNAARRSDWRPLD